MVVFLEGISKQVEWDISGWKAMMCTEFCWNLQYKSKLGDIAAEESKFLAENPGLSAGLDKLQKYKQQKIEDDDNNELENMSVSSVEKLQNVKDPGYKNIENVKNDENQNDSIQNENENEYKSLKQDVNGNPIEEFHDPQNDVKDNSEP